MYCNIIQCKFLMAAAPWEFNIAMEAMTIHDPFSLRIEDCDFPFSAAPSPVSATRFLVMWDSSNAMIHIFHHPCGRCWNWVNPTSLGIKTKNIVWILVLLHTYIYICVISKN